MKLDSYFTPLMKINLKWIKDLHVIPETIKLLEENTREKLLDWSWQSFFGYDTKAEAIKAKTDNFYIGKPNIEIYFTIIIIGSIWGAPARC